MTVSEEMCGFKHEIGAQSSSNSPVSAEAMFEIALDYAEPVMSVWNCFVGLVQ